MWCVSDLPRFDDDARHGLSLPDGSRPQPPLPSHLRTRPRLGPPRLTSGYAWARHRSVPARHRTGPRLGPPRLPATRRTTLRLLRPPHVDDDDGGKFHRAPAHMT